MHAGAAVDLGRVLAGQDADVHGGSYRHCSAHAPVGTARSATRVSAMARQPRVLGIVLAGGEGKAALAADRRPGQTGRPVRRQLPADRLRAVQPGQRRLPADLRADPVQVALARPAHHPDLADVDDARQLRHAGAGAAAARPALVHRQRRRDPAVVQPDLRRPARLHRGVRRRPRVPDGPAADGRAAHRVRRRRHRGRHPGAAHGGDRVRRHRRRRRRQGAAVPGEAGGPARAAGQPRRDATPRWATTSSPPRR